MDEQLCFTTNTTCTVGYLHSPNQTNLKQCSTENRNGSCLVGNKYLFVAQAKKALINVYRIGGSGKRESVEQRLPLPEALSCLEVVENNTEFGNAPQSQLPYLLLGSTASGKLALYLGVELGEPAYCERNGTLSANHENQVYYSW